MTTARHRGESIQQQTMPDPNNNSRTFPEQSIHVETEGAVYDDGKVYLVGNPLETTREIICPNCRLPRLLYPPFGTSSRPIPDPNKEYCKKVPPISQAGLDAHGNPFASDKVNRKKKNPQANISTDSPPSNPANPSSKQPPTEIGFPTVKCPKCPRYIMSSRVAPHLDRCMGLNSRNRTRTPMLGENGNGASATKPSHKRSLEEDEETGPKKKKSATLPKKPKSMPAGSKLKNGISVDSSPVKVDDADSSVPPGGEKKKLKLKFSGSNNAGNNQA